MKKAIYPESAAVYLPKGTKNRLQALDGTFPSTLHRDAVQHWYNRPPRKG